MKRLLAGLLLVAGLLSPTVALVPVQQTAAATREAEQEAQFMASRKSSVYHRPDCRYVKQIKSTNLIVFKSKQEAVAAGYRGCKVCRP